MPGKAAARRAGPGRARAIRGTPPAANATPGGCDSRLGGALGVSGALERLDGPLQLVSVPSGEAERPPGVEDQLGRGLVSGREQLERALEERAGDPVRTEGERVLARFVQCPDRSRRELADVLTGRPAQLDGGAVVVGERLGAILRPIAGKRLDPLCG